MARFVAAAGISIAATAAWAGGDPAEGKKKFDGMCVQCHRSDAQGVPGMGMDLRDAPLIRTGTEAQIADFIAEGHKPTAEYSLGMPPNGGEDLNAELRLDIAAYLKSLAPK